MRSKSRLRLGVPARCLAPWMLICFCALAPVRAIEIAEELLVELSAEDPTAGTDFWANTAPSAFADFERFGLPVAEEVAGITAVSFNTAGADDYYQSTDFPPPGLIGPDPTRSIEAWVYNPVIDQEETIVAWGKRGGPNGTNMSFNYGVNQFYGAVGHWGGDGPDLGWNNAGGAPAASRWHYLAYTYDGETTRVYADGCLVDEANCEANSEFLGAGVINTYGDGRMVVAAQIEPDGFTITPALRGSLSIARLRVHDGVLTPAQIQANYNEECPAICPPPGLPTCLNCPTSDEVFRSNPAYSRRLKFDAVPAITAATVVAPAGGTLTLDGRLRYPIPQPAPASFSIQIRLTNATGSQDFSWTVNVLTPPVRAPIQIAEDLLVDLDAFDGTAGEPFWLNAGTLGDFEKVGDPFQTVLGGESSAAVTFNEVAPTDAYQCVDDAPAGVVGVDPTRTIEVWAYNPVIDNEETLVSWGWRGGPAGTNMSFNYGTNGLYGAVGHWDAPDIGWNDAGGAPDPDTWHHLVYTYDGSTTRVYADGLLQNREVLGSGVINTHFPSRITLAAQLEAGGSTITPGLKGSLSLGQVRIHDGALTASQVYTNFLAERDRYGLPEPPEVPPEFTAVPLEGSFCESDTTYTAFVDVFGVPPPTLEVLSPAGATISAGGDFSYTIPQPSPASFEVSIKASNAAGDQTATWTVTREEVGNALQIAGELFVDLDANDPSAGSAEWVNNGSMDNFLAVGTPAVVSRVGAQGVSFNGLDQAYQSLEDAPEGLVGLDPTRTIEAWVYNEAPLVQEETIVSWGHRGGPDGTNMSFNYGINGAYGAVGHWGAPDIGWNSAGGAPEAGKWHHLAYTYDGTTTRVYADGELANSEELGPGVINTFFPSKITLASQIEADGVTLTGGLKGSLIIGKLRVHDEVLSPCQITTNYQVELPQYQIPCPVSGDLDFADTHCRSIVVEPTGFAFGATHRVTADAVDDTGDDILYTYTATNGVDPPISVGPIASNVGLLILRNKQGPFTFTVKVDDRPDCPDEAADNVCTFSEGPVGTPFHRGDADDNGQLQLTDAVRILGFLFLGGAAPTCFDAGDADDNGQLQLTDAVRILGFLFLGGPPPAAPGPPSEACGVDPTEDTLECASYTHC